MPRANLALQTIAATGIAPTYEAANVDGHSVTNRGNQFVHVKNASAAAINVTFVTPVTVSGRAVADDVVSVPAGGERMIGPFAESVFGQSLSVDLSAVTSVTIGAFTLP